MIYLFKIVIIALSVGGFLFSGLLAAETTVVTENTARVPGLRGILYDATGDPITRNERNSDIATARVDERIAFRFTEQTPGPVESEFFTAEWKGDLHPPITGAYAFAVMSDGAAALWINDELVIEGTPSELTKRGSIAHEFSSSKELSFEVGRTYHLRIKTRHRRTNGIAQLWWRTPEGRWEVVPKDALSTETPPSPRPAGNGRGVSAVITQYIEGARYMIARTDPTVTIDLPQDFQHKGDFRFDVSWLGEIEPHVSTFYRFYTSADGPIAFVLNGEDGRAAITTDVEGPSEQRSGSVFLQAGKRYPFTMTYRQESGVARARLLWSHALSPQKELIPRSQLHAPLRAQNQPKKQGAGLAGRYYNGEEFEQHAFSRLDPAINFDWRRASPKPGPLNADHFSIRWEGEIEAYKTDFYQFSSRVDDRVKVIIDGHTVLDTSRIRAGKTHHALPILLASGRRYPIRIEYADYSDSAYVNLLWSGSDGVRTLIPREALYASAVRTEGTGLRAEYFEGENFEILRAVHPAENVNFDWGERAPDPAVPADHFSVRWTGWLEAPTTDDYTFSAQVDDGVRLRIDNETIIDEWHRVSHYPTEHKGGSKRLTAGVRYPITADYFEYDSPAAIRLLWERPGKPRELISRTALYPAPIEFRPSSVARGTGIGLYAEYFTDETLTSLAASRIDGRIDFLWDHHAPDPAVPVDHFSARWTGWIEAPETGPYTFSARVDDGIRLWINDRHLIDTWQRVSDYPTERRGETLHLEAGVRYPIRVEYFEYDAPAAIQLFWTQNGKTREIIPQRFLYPAPEPIQTHGNGTGLRGRYYKGSDTAEKPALPHPTLERTDSIINLMLGDRTADDRLSADNFSVRWDGFIQPQYSGLYTFFLLADDRATLTIDERPVTTATQPLIATGSDTARESTAQKTLSRDRLYYIRVVYREEKGDARARLSWSHARIPKEIIPRTQLYHPNTSVLAPLGQ